METSADDNLSSSRLHQPHRFQVSTVSSVNFLSLNLTFQHHYASLPSFFGFTIITFLTLQERREERISFIARYVYTYEEFVIVKEAPQCNRMTATGHR